MNKALIIMLSIFIVLLIVFGVMFFLYFPPPERQAAINDKPGILYNTGSSFITNLQDSSSLLKSDIFFELDDKKTLEEFEQNNTKIRDRIITILREITKDDFFSAGFEETLKDSIKSDLQKTMNTDKIKEIYFNELVVQ